MGVARLYVLPTPYTEDELSTLGFEQSVNIMKIDHLNHPPMDLKNYGPTIWTLADTAFGTTTTPPTGVLATAHVVDPMAVGYTPVNHTYVVTKVDATTGQESLISDPSTCSNDLSLAGNYNTITWDADATAELFNVYKEVNGIYGFIGGAAGTTLTDNNILPDLSDTPPGTRLPFAEAGDYPACVTFHEQRAVHGRTLNRANAAYMSQSADFNNYNTSRPAKADDAVTFGLVAKAVNAIQNVLSLGKVLLLFTTDAVWSVKGTNGRITPSDIVPTVEVYRGASRVRPVPVDEMAFFHTAKGNSIRTIGYEFSRDGYRGNDVTVFAPHFFKGYKVVEMYWCEEPSATLWVLRNDGRLLALTWQAEQEVWGWSLCYTDGFVEGISSITENGEDVLYAVVRRVRGAGDDAAPIRTIERLATPNYTDDKVAVFLDSSRTYVGDTAVTTLRGMDHLEGRTVWALADAGVVKNLVVEDGQVTLKNAAKVVIVGLPFESWLRTLPPSGQTGNGSITGLPQQITRVVVSLLRSRAVKTSQGKPLATYLTDATTASDEMADDVFEVKLRENEPYGTPPYLYTGEVSADLGPTDWQENGVVILSTDPVPMNILGISVDNVVGA